MDNTQHKLAEYKCSECGEVLRRNSNKSKMKSWCNKADKYSTLNEV